MAAFEFSTDGVNKPRAQVLDPASTDSDKIKSLLTDELRKIYWMETTKIEVIRQFINKTDNLNVVLELEDLEERTRRKVNNLEYLFEKLQVVVGKKINKPAHMMFEAGEYTVTNAEGLARDAAIILVMQQSEHFEIATYSMMISMAKLIQRSEAVLILIDILKNEKQAQAALAELGETFIQNDDE